MNAWTRLLAVSVDSDRVWHLFHVSVPCRMFDFVICVLVCFISLLNLWVKLIDFKLITLSALASFFVYSTFKSACNCNSSLTDMYGELYFSLFYVCCLYWFYSFVCLSLCLSVCPSVCVSVYEPYFRSVGSRCYVRGAAKENALLLIF